MEHEKIETLFKSIEYRVVRTKKELEEAFKLVYKAYVKKGYITKNKYNIYFSKFNLRNDSTTFIAILKGKIIGTASIFKDSKEMGLPINILFEKEIDKYRINNNIICEIGMLSIDINAFNSNINYMLDKKRILISLCLFKYLIRYITNVYKATYISIFSSKKHGETYRFFGFKKIGRDKVYGKFNGVSAVANLLELKGIGDIAKKNQLVNKYLTSDINNKLLLKKYIMANKDITYFKKILGEIER